MLITPISTNLDSGDGLFARTKARKHLKIWPSTVCGESKVAVVTGRLLLQTDLRSPSIVSCMNVSDDKAGGLNQINIPYTKVLDMGPAGNTGYLVR